MFASFIKYTLIKAIGKLEYQVLMHVADVVQKLMYGAELPPSFQAPGLFSQETFAKNPVL